MEEFFNALYHKDAAKMNSVISRNPSVLQIKVPDNKIEWTLLHVTTSLEFEEGTQLLLESGVDKNQRDKYGWNAAHLAIANGHLGVLKLLLSTGISPNSLTDLHENLVFIAVTFNQPEILRYLITKGANPYTVTLYQMRPDYTAATRGHLQCLKILLKTETYRTLFYDNREEQFKLFSTALTANQILVADYLAVKYELPLDSFNAKEQPRCSDAVWYVKLINARRDNNEWSCILSNFIDETENIFLLIATLRLLGEEKNPRFSFYVNKVISRLKKLTNQETLVRTLISGDAKVAADLISQIPTVDPYDIDNRGMPISWLAIEYDDLDLFKTVLERFDKRKLLKRRDSNENSLLHFAVQNGAISTLWHLIEESADFVDLCVANLAGESALHYAVKYNQEIILQRLLYQYKLNANLLDANLNTPLHIASMFGRNECLVLLKQSGADLSLVNSKNKTPEMIATEKNYSTLLTLLSGEIQALGHLSDSSIPEIKIIVFQGGGIKAIGFYGCLQRLMSENILKLSELRIVSGTSAGAILAFLLAIGYNIDDLGDIMKSIDFYELLESQLRDKFFRLSSQLAKRNGIEELLGENLFKIVSKVVRGSIAKKDIELIFSSFLMDKVSPLGLIYDISKDLGIHNEEFRKLESDIRKVKIKLQPFIDHFSSHRGVFAGEVLRKKLTGWIKQKRLHENLTFQMLHELAQSDTIYKDLYVIAYNADERRTEVFSHETTPDAIVADAVRCSAGIQIVFEPHKKFVNKNGIRCEHDHTLYFDGGSLNNYALNLFDKMRYVHLDQNDPQWLSQYGDNKMTNPHAIGLRLLKPEMHAHYEKQGTVRPRYSNSRVTHFLMNVLASVLSFTKQESDYGLQPDEQRRTIHINTLDIDMLEFRISDERKKKLIRSGQEAVDAFIEQRRSWSTDKAYW